MPERDVRGPGALDVEPIGVGEDVRIPVGGPEEDVHARPLGHRVSHDRRVRGGLPDAVRHRALQPQRLPHSVGDEGGIVVDEPALVGVREQEVEGGADDVRRGLVTGDHDEDPRADRLVERDGVVPEGGLQRAEDVRLLGRVVREQAAARVARDPVDRPHQRDGVRPTQHDGLGHPQRAPDRERHRVVEGLEQAGAPGGDAGLVLRRHAEGIGDHPEREWVGEVFDHVELAPAGEQPLRPLHDPSPPPLHRARHEERRDRPPQPGVVRPVEQQEVPHRRPHRRDRDAGQDRLHEAAVPEDAQDIRVAGEHQLPGPEAGRRVDPQPGELGVGIVGARRPGQPLEEVRGEDDARLLGHGSTQAEMMAPPARPVARGSG